MTSSKFIIGEYYELLALHRALLEAKFCEEPNDLDVSASPIVAMLHKKLLRSLISIEIERKGKTAQDNWDDWLEIGPKRREWKVGLQRARNERLWREWGYKDKQKYIFDLLSPFKVDDNLVGRFISQVEQLQK